MISIRTAFSTGLERTLELSPRTPIRVRPDLSQVVGVRRVTQRFASRRLLSVTCADNHCTPQQLSEMIAHVSRTDDDENSGSLNRGYSWVMIDLGVLVLPTHFTLRHGAGGFLNWTKTFLFQLSKDGLHFLPCEIALVNETQGPISTWTIKTSLNEHSSGFRYIRIHQKSSRHPVCIAGLEVYGQVLSAIDIRSSKLLSCESSAYEIDSFLSMNPLFFQKRN